MSFKGHTKIVITGANGFIAKQLILNLKSANCLVYAVTSSEVNECLWMQSLDYVKKISADAFEYDELCCRISDECDMLINFAWRGIRNDDQNNAVAQATNVINSMGLLRSMVKIGCERVIQIGSIAEYGKQNRVITETSVCKPISEYAKAKLRCYEEMEAYCKFKKVDFLEFRLGSVYGAGMPKDSLLNMLLDSLENNIPFKLNTTCNHLWEYVHVLDVVNILIRALKYKTEGIYNISSSDTRRLKDFIEVIEKKFNKHGYITYGDLPEGVGCPMIFCDNRKIKNTFNFCDFITFEDGIEMLINERVGRVE